MDVSMKGIILAVCIVVATVALFLSLQESETKLGLKVMDKTVQRIGPNKAWNGCYQEQINHDPVLESKVEYGDVELIMKGAFDKCTTESTITVHFERIKAGAEIIYLPVRSAPAVELIKKLKDKITQKNEPECSDYVEAIYQVCPDWANKAFKLKPI